MAHSKHTRSSQITRKQAVVTVPTKSPNTKVNEEEEVTVSKAPIAMAATVADAPATGVTPTTPALRGTKRGRNDEEDENDEDAFYGRKSAKKNKSKGTSEQKPYDQNTLITPAKTPKIPSLESGKRLKFNPEIHGVELEARFLKLQEDMFEKLISPRKAGPNAGGTSTGPGKVRAPGQTVATPRKTAKPKPVKRRVPSETPGTNQGPAKTEESFEPRTLENKKLPDPQDKGAQEVQEAPVSKPTIAPTSTSLTLEKRLQRLASPAPTISKPTPVIRYVSPVRPRTFGSSLAGSPPPVKSSKPLTKPSFALPGDAHMKKRAAEREERRKRMEEAERQKEETKKQQQLHERFRTHTEQKSTKKDQHQGSTVKVSAVPRAPIATTVRTSYQYSTTPKDLVTSARTLTTAISKSEPTQPPISRRLTLDEVNQQLSNESELEEKKKAEEAVLRVRQEAAEKGKESARLWAEQMKAKSIEN